MFKTNVGGLDRIVRIVVGVVALAAFFFVGDAAWRWLLLIGIVPLASRLMGSSPIYTMLGLSTCSTKRLS